MKLKTRPAGSIRDFILENLASHPKDIVSFTAKHFAVTTVAVQQNLKKMVGEGTVIKEGATRGTTWLLSPNSTKSIDITITRDIGEDQVWQKFVLPEIKNKVSENVFSIVQYGFTEMMNNVIDHAETKKAEIQISTQGKILTISVADKGVGIFKKIQRAMNLANPREAILELSKGKVTTDPTRHSGEGIFFTSRVFDKFELESRGLLFLKDNLEDDWLIDSRETTDNPGTIVRMSIRKDAPTQLQEIFDRYSDPETHRFDRTHIVVQLAKIEETDYVSRSQAKRILLGLEKFEHVVLDFRNVRSVGQGFVDEVFRVFNQAHPSVKFEVINANENVSFMISRGIATSPSI